MIERPSDDPALVFEVERFLRWEALLLDQGRYEEWLDLLTDDIDYVVVTRPDVGDAGSRRWLAHLDEDRVSLRQRVDRIGQGNAWAEVPPSLTQRVVGNVLVEVVGEELEVHSGLVVHRVRLEAETEVFAGRREDRLRHGPDGLRLARRRVTLAANALPGKNLSILL